MHSIDIYARPGHQAVEWTTLIDRPHTYNLQSHTPLPTQAPSRSCVSNPSEPGRLGHWRTWTINGCSRGARSRGVTQIERVRQHYSICSLCSAGQLAECRVWVNDPRQSASANFRGRAVHVSPRISRILADLRPQADASAVRTSLVWRLAVRIGNALKISVQWFQFVPVIVCSYTGMGSGEWACPLPSKENIL